MAHDESPIIIWFRHDLRLIDNIALTRAVETGRPIIALYIHDEVAMGDAAYGAASRWWLHHNLKSFEQSLAVHNVPLIIRTGNSLDILTDIIKETRTSSLYYNRVYEPWSVQRDTRIKTILSDNGADVQSFQGHYLFEPWRIKNKSGDAYKVFTPYYKACMEHEDHIGAPLPAPDHINAYTHDLASLNIDDMGFLPALPWGDKMAQHWSFGETGAWERFQDFMENGLSDYHAGRDRPDYDYTSMMSPYLRFGIISPRSLWHTARLYTHVENISEKQTDSFLRELIWREFCNQLLFHFPDMPSKPLQAKFNTFPWQPNTAQRRAWEKGLTGYPIVDAGMRQLWETGWMHNRVRMIVGSLLVKHLLQPWQDGEAWFWDCLIDADLANNSAGWQWIAGCGADAAPYFRVFNPIIQGEKFDPDGDYVRRFVPELANIPDKYIHKPWEAPAHILKQANVILGDTYPHPVIPHTIGRARALEAFESIK